MVDFCGRASAHATAPVSIAAVASPTATPETAEFARTLTADLARFANASESLAVFERDPGAKPDTEYAVRTEIERDKDKIIAQTRLIAVQNGEVLWSRRYEQSGPTLSKLRVQIAANIIGMLRCSFGTLEEERSKARTADVALLMAICQDFEQNNLVSAQVRARQLAASLPDVAIGWAWLAVVQRNLVDQDDSPLKQQAIANAQRAMKIAPGKACSWLARAAVAGRGFGGWRAHRSRAHSNNMRYCLEATPQPCARNRHSPVRWLIWGSSAGGSRASNGRTSAPNPALNTTVQLKQRGSGSSNTACGTGESAPMPPK